MWQIALETGYYSDARNTPRGINLVMIVLGARKLAALSIDIILNGWADLFWGRIIMSRFKIAGMCV